MKEHPIIFQGWKVRKILEWDWSQGDMQTRRVIKPQPKLSYYFPLHDPDGRFGGFWSENKNIKHETMFESRWCPYGQPGDLLWVKETQWRNGGYVATDPQGFEHEGKIPSIYMKRVMSRITLKVVGIRVDRVQKISKKDARAEGIDMDGAYLFRCGIFEIDAFWQIWDSINAKRGYGWSKNPWVWVVTYRRVQDDQ